MEIRYAEPGDRAFVMSIDRHVSEERYAQRVATRSGYVFSENGAPVGLMCHCVLWDNLPFLNFIFIREECRGRGLGAQAIAFWEDDMRRQGYKMTLISTQVDERAQHLYRRLGYVDCGGLLFSGTPCDQPMEMFMRKVL